MWSFHFPNIILCLFLFRSVFRDCNVHELSIPNNLRMAVLKRHNVNHHKIKQLSANAINIHCSPKRHTPSTKQILTASIGTIENRIILTCIKLITSRQRCRGTYDYIPITRTYVTIRQIVTLQNLKTPRGATGAAADTDWAGGTDGSVVFITLETSSSEGNTLGVTRLQVASANDVLDSFYQPSRPAG